MTSSRSTLIVSFTLVFAGGLLVGALGHRYYAINVVQARGVPPPPNPEQWRKQYMSEMTTRLKLSTEQIEKLTTILDETQVRFRSMRERSRAEMDAARLEQVEKVSTILTPEQREEYVKLRKEREERRKAFEKKRPSPGT
jgi:Spy/CpxP family protein refolding chaperone